jgi:predicted nucleotidyltransferase
MNVQDKEQLFDLLRRNASQLRGFGVKRFGLFGSFARGQQEDGSDVDVLIEFEDGRKSFDNFISLAFFLEDLLGRKVDLVTPESLSPHIGPHILREVEYAQVGA